MIAIGEEYKQILPYANAVSRVCASVFVIGCLTGFTALYLVANIECLYRKFLITWIAICVFVFIVERSFRWVRKRF